MEQISWADDELANEILNDDEIVEVVRGQKEEKEGDSEAGNGVGILTRAEGSEALELATTYAEQ